MFLDLEIKILNCNLFFFFKVFEYNLNPVIKKCYIIKLNGTN